MRSQARRDGARNGGRGRRSGEGPSHAAVDLFALRANLAELRRRAHGRDVIAVVKADGYGHGAVPVARALLSAGCTRLAVLSAEEGAELRDADLATPILLLGGVHTEEEAACAAALGLTPVVHHEAQRRLLAEAARRRGRPVRIHVEVDTGMSRMGVPPDDAPSFLASCARETALVLEGVYTHLACADEPDLAPSLEQLARFRRVLGAARDLGATPPVVHAANSAALLAGKPFAEALPEATAVRPGLALYGVRPARFFDVALRPVMTFRTRVVQVRSLALGDAVGYAATYRARAPTRIATLPVGYEDGVPVALSNRGCALVRGERLPIAGRVSMDFVTVDAGDRDVEVGDEAVLFGVGLPVEEVAEAAATIPYELLIRVGARIPRVYTDSNTGSAPDAATEGDVC